MKIDLSMLSVVTIALVTVAATVDRVSTAPERIRLRTETAKASCLRTGGEWVRDGRHDVCRTAAASKGS